MAGDKQAIVIQMDQENITMTKIASQRSKTVGPDIVIVRTAAKR